MHKATCSYPNSTFSDMLSTFLYTYCEWLTCAQCNRQLGVRCEAPQESAEGTSVSIVNLSTGEYQQCALQPASTLATNPKESQPVSSAVPGTVARDERHSVASLGVSQYPQSIGKHPEKQSEVPTGHPSVHRKIQGVGGPLIGELKPPQPRQVAGGPPQSSRQPEQRAERLGGMLSLETAPLGDGRMTGRQNVSFWPFSPPSKKVDPPKPPFHFNMTEAELIADLQSAVYCDVRLFTHF
jgi:hypothetical protein